MKKIWGLTVGVFLLTSSVCYALTDSEPTKKMEISGTVDVNDVSPGSAAEVACARNEEHRTSDLCAQWKAADAARDAANFSLGGLIVGVVSTIFGVVGTAVAAMAALAVFSAERAWITFHGCTAQPTPVRTKEGKSAGAIVHIGVTLKNTGKSPAKRARYFISAKTSSADVVPTFSNSDLKEWTMAEPMIPMEDIVGPIKVDGRKFEANFTDNEVIYVYCVARYRDVFLPFVERRTDICRVVTAYGNGPVTRPTLSQNNIK